MSQDNPCQEIVCRGQAAIARQRRAFEDWLDIAEALLVGRTVVMRATHTNTPTGARFEKAMAEWLIANSFREIDKAARCRLLECLQHRAEIEVWRSRLTDSERFRFNHPNTVWRKWRAATSVPVSNTEIKLSAVAKFKARVAFLEEENHRMRRDIERGGGDLWTRDDRAQDIAQVILATLSKTKAKDVAHAILRELKKDESNSKSDQIILAQIGGAA